MQDYLPGKYHTIINTLEVGRENSKLQVNNFWLLGMVCEFYRQVHIIQKNLLFLNNKNLEFEEEIRALVCIKGRFLFVFLSVKYDLLHLCWNFEMRNYYIYYMPYYLDQHTLLSCNT